LENRLDLVDLLEKVANYEASEALHFAIGGDHPRDNDSTLFALKDHIRGLAYREP
jgi:hypothetical protein